MSVKLECDRCGVQEKTGGVMLFARLGGPGLPKHQVPLPEGWIRPRMPNEDGSADERELCPACKADLIRFMSGAPVIDDSELASTVMRIADPKVCRACGHKSHRGTQCRELTMPGAPGDVDECGCTEGVPDLGTGARPDQICPDCGHLRHHDPCPDPVPEKGSCGCGLMTARWRMKELGIDG